MLDYKNWAEKQWPSSSFFDLRHQKRVINIVLAMLRHPSASIPARFEVQKEIKGCYRLLDNKTVDHQMLQCKHYKNVIAEATSASGRVLFIQDGSELIYNNLKWTDLGPTADSSGNGIMFHSCLAVKFHGDQPEVIGLTGQKAWIREHQKKGSNRKIQEGRESGVWQEMITRIGPVPENCKWTTVGDRGSDIFSFIESLDAGWDCVIRSKHDRKILVDNKKQSLKKYIRGISSMGAINYSMRARKGPACETVLNISWTEVDVLPPEAQKEKNPVRGCYVRAWSEDDSNLEWILFTRSQIISLEEALEIITIYKHRWLIEEYHKCLKTGCQIEEVQLKTSDRLLTLFGLLGVVATQLLQLKHISRIHPDEPAEKYVNKDSLIVLQSIYNLKSSITVKEYWRRVAMLVGFMGRKSDGGPGWKKIWEGWIRLRDLCKGVEIGRKLGSKCV